MAAEKTKTPADRPPTAGELAQGRAALGPDPSDAEIAAFTARATEPERHPPVSVRSSLESRRRAGRTFGLQPVTIPADTLTRAEIEAIGSDPYLTMGQPVERGAAD